MKTAMIVSRRFGFAPRSWACGLFLLVGALSSFGASAPSRNVIGETFPSAEAAVQALASAAQARDRNALRIILGPTSDELQMSDKVQGDEELTQFAEAFAAGHQIRELANNRATLEVGANGWPFPIPLVHQGGKWYFDTEAGKDEVLNRRIGRNELWALRAVRAYADAQRDYARHDHDGSQVLKYAQNFLSTPGKRDGLYWPPEPDGELSPLGPLVATAQAEGYMTSTHQKSGPRPFHGYYFKILTKQGSHAAGGKYDYVINHNMIGGFALLAWPADYGNSGIMSFMINQQGRVYQKDLGPHTASVAKKIHAYDPDATWHPSPE